MKTIKTMEELKAQAIAIKASMEVRWDLHNMSETLNPMEMISKFENCYEMNNSVITFVSEGLQYVIPYTRVVMRILNENNFRNKCMYVPFSNGDYPVAYKSRWDVLWRESKELWEQDFHDDCKKFSDEQGFGSITDDLLKKCFLIPKSGVFVKHPYWEQTYYPQVHSFDCTAVNRVGHYTTNNGTCVFIYRDGNTYVTRNWDVVEALRETGYKEGCLYVPFSNGEVIQDPTLKLKWEKLIAA